MVLALPIGVGLGAVGVALVASRVPAWKPARGVALAVAATCLLGQLAVSQLKHYDTAAPRPGDAGRLYAVSAALVDLGASPGGRCIAQRARRRGLCHAEPVFRRLGDGAAGLALGRAGPGVGRGPGVFRSPRTANAHFLSQTVWSAALLWFLGAVVFYPLIAGRGRLVGASGQGRRYAGMVADRRESGHLGGRPDRHRMISGTV